MTCENGGFQLQLVLAFENINGTATPVLRPKYEPCPTNPGPIYATVFLALIFVTSVVLNSLVILTIVTSYTLKRYQYSHLLVNLCVTCILDCLFNITVAISYVTTVPWRFGYYMCYFNSFTINMITCQMTFAVLFLTIDRLCVAKKFVPYMSISKLKMNILVFLTWLSSFLLSSPIVCGYMASMPYRKRYSCAVSDPKDDYYFLTHFVIILIVSTVLIVVNVTFTALTFHKERKKQRKVKGNQSYKYLDQILMTPYYRNEVYPALFVGGTAICYLILWFPFSSLSIIDPMVTQHWNNETSSSHKLVRNWVQITDNSLPDGNAFIDDNDLLSNMTTNSTTRQQLVPEIDATPAYECVFIWMRFMFNVCAPVCILVILREVRSKSEGLLGCCRPNSVDVASPKPFSPPNLRKSTTFRAFSDSNDKHKRSKNKNMVNFRTPVLFATSDGLYIRTVEDSYLQLIDNKPILSFAKNSNIDPEFTYDLCDVMLGYEDLTNYDEQHLMDDPSSTDGEVGTNLRVEMDNDFINITQEHNGARKRHSFENATDVSDNEILDLETREHKNNKNKKNVRFNTALNEEIPRPTTMESSVLDSSRGSTNSSDSGILADNEIVSEITSPIVLSSHNNKKKQKGTKVKTSKKQPHVVHNVRKSKQPNNYSNSPNSNTESTSKTNGQKKSKRKPLATVKTRNIKSRHLGKRQLSSDENDDN